MGEVESKPGDLGSDRGYRVVEFEIEIDGAWPVCG
jgi:hypothetical protein